MAKTTKTKPKNVQKKVQKKTASKMAEPKQLITKDMTLGEVMQRYPESGEVMFKHGMHCIGCHISAYETIEQGAAAHGIELKKFLEDLNNAAKKKK